MMRFMSVPSVGEVRLRLHFGGLGHRQYFDASRGRYIRNGLVHGRGACPAAKHPQEQRDDGAARKEKLDQEVGAQFTRALQDSLHGATLSGAYVLNISARTPGCYTRNTTLPVTRRSSMARMASLTCDSGQILDT
jgi:hypothetical protein